MYFLHLHSIHLLRTYTVFVGEQAQVQVCTLYFLSCVVLKVLTLLTLSVKAVNTDEALYTVIVRIQQTTKDKTARSLT